MSATEVEIKGYRRFSPDNGRNHKPQGQQGNGPGYPHRALQPEPDPPHHDPGAEQKREYDAVCQQKVCDRAEGLCPGSDNSEGYVGHQQKENRAHPHIDGVGTVKAGQAKGDDRQKQKKKRFQHPCDLRAERLRSRQPGSRLKPRWHRPATAPYACRPCQPGSQV